MEEGFMHRFALDIDPVTYVRNMLGGETPDPVQSVVLAELGGAESIVCYLRDDLSTTSERDLALFRQIVKTYLNVRSNITEENIRKLLRVKPDMLTFVTPAEVSVVEPKPLNVGLYENQLQNYIPELRSNNILSSVLIEPSIAQVKLAGRLEFDYIEIDATGLSEATDMDSEMQALAQIEEIAMAANKLGMGVNISGKVGYENMRDIANIEYLEDIIVGKPVLIRALAIGFEQAVRDILTLL